MQIRSGRPSSVERLAAPRGDDHSSRELFCRRLDPLDLAERALAAETVDVERDPGVAERLPPDLREQLDGGSTSQDQGRPLEADGAHLLPELRGRVPSLSVTARTRKHRKHKFLLGIPDGPSGIAPGFEQAEPARTARA